MTIDEAQAAVTRAEGELLALERIYQHLQALYGAAIDRYHGVQQELDSLQSASKQRGKRGK